MIAILKKDLRIIFSSPLAYVSLAVFLFLNAFAFRSQVTQVAPGQLPEASMRGMLYFIIVVLLFLTPFLTMRSFAEEARQKTIELLYTAPVAEWKIVCAKFLSVFLFYTIMLVASLEFPILMLRWAEPEIGPLILCYLGLWLAGAAFLSLGVLASSLVKTPMIAAVMSFVSLLSLWFVGGAEQAWVQEFSLITHIESFAIGLLEVKDVAFYLLFTIGCLFLTVRSLEAQRWK